MSKTVSIVGSVRQGGVARPEKKGTGIDAERIFQGDPGRTDPDPPRRGASDEAPGWVIKQVGICRDS